MRVTVVGDALIDEMRDSQGSVDAPGGSALNVAVGLSVLGAQSTLVAMFGDDPDGRVLANHLAAHGVATLASPARLGTGRAVSDRTDGEPRYSFNAAQVERIIDFNLTAPAFAEAEVVAVSGFPFDDLAQAERLRESVHGTTLFIDPNPRRGLLRDPRAFARTLEDFAATTHLVKIGDEDVELLWGEPVPQVARRLLDAGADTVLTTAGRDGAILYLPDHTVHCPIAPLDAPIVDTMGAGDSTFAAVISRHGLGEGWDATLRFAMAIAAETIRHPGGMLRTPIAQ